MDNDSTQANEVPKVRVVKRNMPPADSVEKKSERKFLGLPIWAIVAIAAIAYYFYSGGVKSGSGDTDPNPSPRESPRPAQTPRDPSPRKNPRPVQDPRNPAQRPVQSCSTCGGKRLVRVSCPCATCSVVKNGNVVVTAHGGRCVLCGGEGGAIAPNGAVVICPSCGGRGFAICDQCNGTGEVLAMCPSCGGSGRSLLNASNVDGGHIKCRVSEKLKARKDEKNGAGEKEGD